MAHASRTFRIFVSSTFSDLKEERNALQKKVFPRLRELCMQHGCRFQAIDLRWGVREEANLDQQTMKICYEEIARCQRVTPRPNFIVLLGDRYGWRPLPFEIPAYEFMEIEQRVSDTDKELLKKWYRRDDNAVPPVYCLQPRIGEFADYTKWEVVESRLHSILLHAAGEMKLTADSYVKYFASATEQEIIQGLKASDIGEHVFCFVRSIKEIPHTPGAKDFIDLDEMGNLDRDANKHLNDLKDRLQRLLPGNIYEYAAEWTGNGTTAEHVDRLCRDVYVSLSIIILKEIVKLEESDPLDKEITDHIASGKDRAKFFIGRTGILKTISEYVKGTDSHPLAVSGASGSGKSALMAHAAEKVQNEHKNAEVVVRFIGATPNSSDVRTLLESLCRQISRCYGADESTIPADYKDLIMDLPKRLALATAAKPLFLFLDALDQLSSADKARNLIWLPAELPVHVRLVVSTPPGKCLSGLKKKLPEANFAELEPMPPYEGAKLLDMWLDDAHRKLQEDQRAEILRKFERCGMPLYLRLAFGEAQRWKSYDGLPRGSKGHIGLSEDIPGIIRDMFWRLAQESNHGHMLLERSLGYLAASRNGLTEDEMLDVLSQDAELYQDFLKRTYHKPPEQRLPVVVWSRLFFDLEPYLIERRADNTTVLSFYHRQVGEVVMKLYLDGEDKLRAHRRLAEYFRLKADPDRKHLWQQNPRLLGELPFHLAHGARETELHELFSQLAFLSARVATGKIYEQVDDYSLAGSPLPSALAQWHVFLHKHAQRLTQHPEMLIALVNHEGFPEARAQVADVPWQQPWLRTSPEQMPAVEAKSKEGLHVEVTGNLQFHWSRVSALAPERAVTFCLERLGIICVFDMNSMQQTDAILSIRRDRPLILACAPDATSVSVFYDSGKAELYRCIFGQNELPSRLELVIEFSFHLPESENPVVVWHKGAFWYQAKAGTIDCISVESPHIFEETLPVGQQGELSALVFVEDTRLVMLRQGFDTLLLTPGAPPLRRQFAHVATACACGGRKVAAAFTDGALVVFEVADTLTAKAEVRAGMLRGVLGWDGSRLLWVGESSGFNAWHPEEASPQPVQDNQEVFPSHLHSLPCQWFSQPDGSILLGTTHSVVTFNVLEGGAVTDGRLEDIFGGPVWRAVRKRGEDQWLLEKQPLREVLLGRGVKGRLYCAPDGRGQFFAASGYGPGLVFDLAMLQAAPLQGCPLGINIAVGEDDGGCWFIDRAGDIYFADSTARCRCVAKIGLPDVFGSLIVNCGDYIVWAGYSSKYFPETGNDPARTFVFFTKVQKNPPMLERLGEQFRHPKEGLCVAICYEKAAERLVTLWVKEVDGAQTYNLRVGSVKDFARWQFKEIDVSGLGPFTFVQASLSANGRLLGVVNMAGGISCLSVEDGRVLANLAGSAPFTAVAPGADGSEFWLVEARARVYRCALVEGTT